MCCSSRGWPTLRYESSAQKGNAVGQHKLGWAYFNGTPTLNNTSLLFPFARRHRTHLECVTGDGVEKDESKAGEWWHKASAQGHAAAQCDLGWAYDNGRGVPKDSAKAVELYDPYMSVRQAS